MRFPVSFIPWFVLAVCTENAVFFLGMGLLCISPQSVICYEGLLVFGRSILADVVAVFLQSSALLEARDAAFAFC